MKTVIEIEIQNLYHFEKEYNFLTGRLPSEKTKNNAELILYESKLKKYKPIIQIPIDTDYLAEKIERLKKYIPQLLEIEKYEIVKKIENQIKKLQTTIEEVIS